MLENYTVLFFLSKENELEYGEAYITDKNVQYQSYHIRGKKNKEWSKKGKKQWIK